MAMHVRKDDTVIIITGEQKGSRGKVLRVDACKGVIVVEGVNMVYRHVRPSQANPQGGRLHVEKPINISNVMLINPKTNEPTRVSFKTNDKGKKVRVARDGTEIN